MDKKFVGLIALLIISSSLLLVLTITSLPGGSGSPIYNAIRSIARAREEFTPDPAKSVMLCQPLQLPAGQNTIISIFARNDQERGIPNKTAVLTTTLGTITLSNSKTDKNGKAEFRLTSQASGSAEIGAAIEGVQLNTKCTVVFK